MTTTLKDVVGANRKRGRGKAQKSLDLIEAAREILEEIQPATVRACCYQLFTRNLLPDMSKNSTQKVSKQLVWARENGVIPWHWIVDEHRRVERATQWNNPDSIIDAAVAGYRRDNWREQPHWIQVWSEKGTIRGIIAPVLDRYGVGFQNAGGFGGATTVHDIAIDSAASDKPLTILYVGDRDPSGMFMSEVDLPGRIARYDGTATVRRLALTADDVAGWKGFPAKKKDPRYAWYVKNHGETCWELDELSPALLRQRIENAILEMIDPGPWDRALLVERAETEALHHYQDHWKASISRLVAKYSNQGAQS